MCRAADPRTHEQRLDTERSRRDATGSHRLHPKCRFHLPLPDRMTAERLFAGNTRHVGNAKRVIDTTTAVP